MNKIFKFSILIFTLSFINSYNSVKADFDKPNILHIAQEKLEDDPGKYNPDNPYDDDYNPDDPYGENDSKEKPNSENQIENEFPDR